MKYYYEPNDKWYNTKQELVDAYNEDFEGTHSTKVTIENWTEEQWNTIWKPSMKKLQIKTEKATLLVVDLPKFTDKEAAPHFTENILLFSQNNGLIISRVDFKNDMSSFKHLEKVSEIIEEEWQSIVGLLSMKNTVYKDYMNKGCCLGTATESGLSLLKANGVLLEPKNTPLLSSAWMEARQEVWSNPHIFIKVD